MSIIWTGTGNFTNGSSEVTVTDGPVVGLNDFNCTNGSLIIVGGVAYFVAARTSSIAFTLSRDFEGATDTDVPFEISPVTQNTTSSVELVTVLASVRASLNVLDRNSQGLFFNHIGVTGDADPGPGNLALDHADPSVATELYVDYLDANTAHRNVSQILARFAVGTTIRLRSLASTAFYEYDLIGTALDQTGWFKLFLSYVAHDGVIGDGEAVALSWIRSGEGLDVDNGGTFAGRSAFDEEDGGFFYLSSDGNGLDPEDEGFLEGSVLFIKSSPTTADWSDGFPLTGPRGFQGWAPRLGLASDGARRIFQLTGWVGGQGTAPTIGVNQYIGAAGLVSDIANGVDVRGIPGLSAYQVAVALGFSGDEAAWVASLKGDSAYLVAVANGFVGTAPEWLSSLNGADGTDPGALFNWDDSTADADPGAGNMRANSADLSVAEFLYVSKTGRTGDDLEAFLLGIGSSTNTIKGHVTLTSSGGNAQAIMRVISLTDATDYVKIGLQESTHAGATGFVDAAPISLQFNLAGNQGAADEVSMASAINGSPEVTDPAALTKFAITDPDNGDLLSWISFEGLSDAIKPRALVDAKTANYTVLAADLGKNINIDASAAARTITLPPVATAGNGFDIGIRKSDSSANTVTIDGDGAETINGATTLVLRSQRESVRLVCNGTAWIIASTGAAFTGDSGAGGAIGSVPPPSAGDAAAGKLLSAGGGWVAPDVTFTQLLTYQGTLALEMAEDRSTGPVYVGPDGNGLADGFNVLTYVDVAGATNLNTAVAGELRPSTGSDTVSNNGAVTTVGGYNGLEIGDRAWALTNGETVTKIGASRTAAMTSCKVKIVQRISAGTYDVLYSETFNHPGGGYSDKTLSTPFEVPASGDFYATIYSPSNASTWDLVASGNRFYRTGDGAGNGVTFTEDTGGKPALRVTYSGVPTDLSVESESLNLVETPDWGMIFALIDPGGGGINSDIVLSISRDDGADYAAVTMTELWTRPDGVVMTTSGLFDLSGLDAGAVGKWRIETANEVPARVLATSIYFGAN